LVEGGGHVSQLAQADQCRSGSSADEEAAGTFTVIAWTGNESVPIQLTQCWFPQGWPFPTGNESVPKIIINDAINLFFFETATSISIISNRISFRVLFDTTAYVCFI